MKVFQIELASCEPCPNCVHDNSQWSGKLLSGAMQAKADGVPLDMAYSSDAAYCKDLRRMLPYVEKRTPLYGGLKTKIQHNPTFAFPADCRLRNAGTVPAPGGATTGAGTSVAREVADELRRQANKLAP